MFARPTVIPNYFLIDKTWKDRTRKMRMLLWKETYHIVIVDMQDFLAASTPFLPLANFKEDLLYTHALLHAYIYSNYFSISCIQMYIQAWNIWIRIGEVEKLRFFFESVILIFFSVKNSLVHMRYYLFLKHVWFVQTSCQLICTRLYIFLSTTKSQWGEIIYEVLGLDNLNFHFIVIGFEMNVTMKEDLLLSRYF